MQASTHIPCRYRYHDSVRAGAIAVAARLWSGLAVLMLGALAAAAAATPAAPARAASPESMAVVGLPPIQNFDPSDYRGAAQNWAVTQGPDGVIYVGNSEDGVLTFDGSQWQRIPVRDKLVVRSLATGPGGRIYVGTVGDFGYLAPDAAGQLHYVSLLDKVPTADRAFADVWNIHVAGNTVYFATEARLFAWHGGQIHVITPRHPLHMTFMVDGVLYAREDQSGLMRLSAGQLEPVAGGERFAEQRVYALLPWRGANAKPGELLAATRSHGWLWFDGKAWHPWPTEADAALAQADIYGAAWLADGGLAVATLKDGLYVLDRRGRLLAHLDHANGLASDIVLSLFQDREDGLWLATGSGVSRVNFSAPLTHFDASSGLFGATLAITRHAGTLYVDTSEGAFRLTDDVPGSPHFERLRGAPGQNWSFAAVDGQLLTTGNEGVFAIEPDGNTRPVLQHRAGYALASQAIVRSKLNPSRVFVGYQDGIGSVRWSGARWIDEGRISGTRDEVVALAVDAAGRVWAGLGSGGILRITLPPAWQGPDDPRPATIQHFDDRAGLPKGPTRPVIIDGRADFLGNGGIYDFDPRTHRFALDPAFASLFPEGPRSVPVARVGQHGRVWMYTENPALGIRETGYAMRSDGRWRWHVAPLQPLAGEGVLSIYQDADGALWLGAYNTLFHLNRPRAPVHDGTLATLIRGATTGGDAPLRVGSGALDPHDVPWARNDLRFQFALASFDDVAANTYQVYLQGADPGWSAWSTASYSNYTNLSPGHYVFHVRGRDVYGHAGREASFAFRILPPWYRTPWAWTLWIALTLLVPALFMRWRSAALRHRNRALALLVNLRTSELAQANEALAKNNTTLAEQSITDPLTGLRNRRYLYDHIAQDLAVARRRRGGGPRGASAEDSNLIFLMLDIDHFKAVNDQYGHGAGDHVLEQLAGTLRRMTRATDVAVRWGGEEFLLVARFAAPDCGTAFAERLRATVAAHAFDLGDGQSIHCTCSIGFATYPLFRDAREHLAWEKVVNMADACLYAAKLNGRNAWAGLLPLDTPPAGDPLEVLRATLAAFPAPGPLTVRTSWSAPPAGGAAARPAAHAPA